MGGGVRGAWEKVAKTLEEEEEEEAEEVAGQASEHTYSSSS